jgi:hypothetical protein
MYLKRGFLPSFFSPTGCTTAWMQEVERLRTNIGHIRVKMSGTYFPDKVEVVETSNSRFRLRFQPVGTPIWI